MHEFVECRELEGYFGVIKQLIKRCWDVRFVERMEWRELWLFGVNERMKGCNTNLLNYLLSHAKFAVKLRRNLAHYEKKKVKVWSLFKSMVRSEINMLHGYIKEELFKEGFVEGSTFVGMGEHRRMNLDFGEEAQGENLGNYVHLNLFL